MPNDHVYKRFADDDMLFVAIHDFLRDWFDEDIADTNMTNELLGQKARARLEGKAAVDAAFRVLKNYKTGKENKPQVNPAR